MNDNNTVLTEADIRRAIQASTTQYELCRAIERAVLAKLPGMPAVEWLKEHERLARAFGGAEYDYGYVDGDGDQELTAAETRSDAARDTLLAHARQRTQPAASEADQIERALYELVDKIAPGLDSGDLVADAKEASRHLDQRAPSEAGAVPVDAHAVIQEMIGVATTDEADSDWHPDHKTMVDQWQSRLQIALNLPAAPPSAPAAQPEKQAGQVSSVRLTYKNGKASHPASFGPKLPDGEHWFYASPPAPIQQAAPAVEPVPRGKVRDRGFVVVDGKHVPTVLVEFGIDDWDSRDRFAASVAAPAAESAEPVNLPDPHGCNKCQHPNCGRFNGPRQVECRAMADNACARHYAPTAATADALPTDNKITLNPDAPSLTFSTADAQGDEQANGHGKWWKWFAKLPRHSFILTPEGNGVRRVVDKCGSWIDEQKAGEVVEDAEAEIHQLRGALNCMLTFFGMDEDAENKTVFDQARQALHDIAYTKNLTATPQQFADHLQREARAALSRQPSAPASAEMPNIQRFNPVPGLGMNPHSTGLYVRYEDHCAAVAVKQDAPAGVEDEDATLQRVKEAVAVALGDAYDCLRVWSAWSYGTMRPDDFRLVAVDDGRLHEIASAALAAAKPTETQLAEAATIARDMGAKSMADTLTAVQHAGVVQVCAECDIADCRHIRAQRAGKGDGDGD